MVGSFVYPKTYTIPEQLPLATSTLSLYASIFTAVFVRSFFISDFAPSASSFAIYQDVKVGMTYVQNKLSLEIHLNR